LENRNATNAYLEAQIDVAGARIAELLFELHEMKAMSAVDHERCFAAEARAALSNEQEQVRVDNSCVTVDIGVEDAQLKQFSGVATVVTGNRPSEQVEESEGAQNGGATALLLPETIGSMVDDMMHPMQMKEVLELNGSVENLHVLLKELQKNNAALQRQMDSRPIVYQFGEIPDCVLDDDCDYEGKFPFHTTNHNSEYFMGRKLDFHTFCRVLYRGFMALRYRCAKCFLKCRKLKCTKCTELRLRTFTRLLLRRPPLLWLFYMQLFAIWIVEIWRQVLCKVDNTPHQELKQPVFSFLSN